MARCTVEITLHTNKQRITVDEPLIRVMNRALQYVTGNRGFKAELAGYEGTTVHIKLFDMKMYGLDENIDNFFFDFDAAVRALAIHIQKGVSNRFFAPRKYSNIKYLQNGTVFREDIGKPIADIKEEPEGYDD